MEEAAKKAKEQRAWPMTVTSLGAFRDGLRLSLVAGHMMMMRGRSTAKSKGPQQKLACGSRRRRNQGDKLYTFYKSNASHTT